MIRGRSKFVFRAEKLKMNINQIHISPSEIQIQPSDIARLMSVETDVIPEPFNEIITGEILEIANYSNIQGGYVLSDKIEIDIAENIFTFENTIFHPGKRVAKYLKNSETLALFVCTAGEEVSKRSRELMDKGMILEGYIIDLFGSMIVEEAMNIIQSKLSADLAEMGLFSSNRYSPGYCDWDVAEQQKLFSFFPKEFCGVSLNDSSLMHPVKSISGVIGIGSSVKFHKYSCNQCNNSTCLYRNLKRML
jgi:hypothetical protein